MNNGRVWIAVSIIVVALVAAIALGFLFFSITGLYLGGLVAGIIALSITLFMRVPFDLPGSQGAEDLYDLGRALRLNGVRVTESDNEIGVHVSASYTLEMRYAKGSAAYGLGWTVNALIVIMLLVLTGIGGVVVAVDCIGGILAADRFFRRNVHQTLAKPLPRAADRRDDIGQLLMFSLSDALRLATDVQKVRRSKYEDAAVLALVLIGLIGGIVSAFPLMTILVNAGWAESGFWAIGISFTTSLIVTFLVILLIRRKMIPKTKKADDWVRRLDVAMAREEAGKAEDGESAVGLLIEASAELPEWLQVREKGRIDSSAAIWILILLVGYPGAYAIFGGLVSLASGFGDPTPGLLSLSVGAVMLLATFVIYRLVQKQERAKSHLIRREWERRQQYLTKRLEELVQEM